ncbi:Six-hairpin glycosidase-like protein [Sporodiniella umbellata]|nr:Six-hairpin glycosidase-like protein [Sporodiniella umbellata]
MRSGKLPADNRVSWRNDSALTDGSDVHLDLSGGYYDAGDYLKLTFPLSYTVFMLSWGGMEYYEGYKLANQTDYLKSQIKWATDWLIKAHPQRCTLYIQVGNATLDHSYFGLDTNIPLPRPSYQINETHFGTDAASMASAAFATASSFFRVQNESDYADTLLSHSKQLYNCSKSIDHVRYQKSVPTATLVYGSTDYLDDLVLSSLALYKTTGDKSYFEDTLEFYQDANWTTNRTEPLGWDNKYGAVYVLMADALFDPSKPKQSLTRRSEAEYYLDRMTNLTGVNQTQGGLLYWNGYSDENSNANAMSSCFLLLTYSKKILRPLFLLDRNNTAVENRIQRYETLAFQQLDYIFGKNPIEQNYVVGERPNSPKYPHSALAAGFRSLTEAFARPNDTSQAHTIYGALVGGPSKNDQFTDKRLDWGQTEIALDYNACYQSVLAYQVMYSPHGPFYETKAPKTIPENPPKKDPTLPGWVLAVSVVLPVAALCLIFLYFCCCCRRKAKTMDDTSSEGSTVGATDAPSKKPSFKTIREIRP